MTDRLTELRQLRQAVAAARGGAARVVHVSGESGSGKSLLVDAVLADAALDGVPIHRGAAAEFERDRTFGVLADALNLSVLAVDPARAAIGRLLARSRDPHRTEARHETALRIAALAGGLGATGPVLVVLEDLQWVDELTALAIRHTLTALRPHPACVLMTSRPLPVNLAVADAVRLGGTDSVEMVLAPLGLEVLLGIAEAELGAAPGPGLARLLADCGGNPSYAAALIEGLAREDALLARGPVVDTRATVAPAGLRRLVLARLARLDDECRDLLTLAALLAPTFSVDQVGAAMGRDVWELLPVLRAALDAQLLEDDAGRMRFRHGVVRQTLVEGLTPALRESLDRSVHAAIGAAAGSAEASPRFQIVAPPVGIRALPPPAAADPPGIPQGWETMTRTEHEVVRLAARGLTNRQVGERLFISPRTVETHLSHVFAKLDIRSRVELAHVVGRLVEGQGAGAAHAKARAGVA